MIIVYMYVVLYIIYVYMISPKVNSLHFLYVHHPVQMQTKRIKETGSGGKLQTIISNITIYLSITEMGWNQSRLTAALVVYSPMPILLDISEISHIINRRFTYRFSFNRMKSKSWYMKLLAAGWENPICCVCA